MTARTGFRWRVSPRVGLAAMLVLALAVRLAVIAATPHFAPIYDAHDYDRIGQSVANTGHYPPTYFAKPGTATALNPPGYPYLLGATYAVVGHSWTAGRVLGALLGTVTVLLLALIAWRLWGSAAGVIAGFLGAVYPPLVMVNASLISEALFLPLLMALVLLLVTQADVEGRNALVVAVAAGVLCGLGAFARSVGLLLVVVVLVWVLQRKLTARRRLGMAALVVAGLCVTLSPWTIRNARDFHTFLPLSTEDGAGFVGAYNSESAHGNLRLTWRPAWLLPQYRRLFNDGLNEAQLDSRWRSDALHFMAHHPGYPVEALGLNTLRMFGLGPGSRYLEGIWYDEMGIPHRAQAWTRVSVYVMTLLAVFGAIAGRRLRRRRDWFIWLFPLVLLVATALILGGPRYRLPIDPFLVLFATSGFAALAYRRGLTHGPPGARKMVVA